MTHYVVTVDLADDAAIDTYRAHHRRVRPEVLDSVRRVGIKAMEIHILGRRLVMVVDPDGRDVRRCFAARHGSSSPPVVEWETLMRSLLLLPPPGAAPGEWWTLMEPVFRLEPQEDASATAGQAQR
jgi:L-rhamnose mutarotase